MKLIIICLCLASICAEPPRTAHHGRIIGGTVANAGQFPFAAAIYRQTNDGVYFCTGSLINTQWILTAGQCVVNAIIFTIRLGSNSLSSNDALRLATDEYFVHPDNEGFLHDIGLIKLRLPVELTDYISPTRILETSPPDYMGVQTFGWGQTSDSDTGLVDELHHVGMLTVSVAECRRTFGDVITDNMVCTNGGFNEGTCNGDLGSPLLVNWGGLSLTWVIGVSSFISSNGCESTDPSGFTRTHPYLDWIKDIIANN